MSTSFLIKNRNKNRDRWGGVLDRNTCKSNNKLFKTKEIKGITHGENLRLRLGHIDNRSGHTPDEDHAPRALTAHEVPGHLAGKEVGAIHVDAPEAAHAIGRVLGRGEVLGEAGRGDEVVDSAVPGKDGSDAGLDRVWV